MKNMVLKKLKTFKERSRFEDGVLTYIASQSISKRDRERLADTFRMLDADKSGKLSKEELFNNNEIYTGQILTEKEKDELFSSIDVDNSGSVSYTEFIAAAMTFSDKIAM